MYTPVLATLRYGKLSNGDHIPLSYALETDDGRYILFQSDNDWASLAYYLGAAVDPDVLTREEILEQHSKAVNWLDDHLGEQFDIAGSYDEFLEGGEE